MEIPSSYSNLSSEEWGAIRSLADDRRTVKKKGRQRLSCSGLGQR